MTTLYESIGDWENLFLAWRLARRGKSARAEVAEFALNLESELFELQEALTCGCWQPSPVRHFTIYERKPRMITVAPFRDRVMQHAIMNVVEPVLDAGMCGSSYACRKGKGVHKAVNRYQHLAQRYPYVLKLDVKNFFGSIDYAVLMGELAHRIEDLQVLELLSRIIYGTAHPQPAQHWYPGDDLLAPVEREHGLPIGNLTSQIFANVYLDPLDRYLRVALGKNTYIRYVDDLFVFADSKQALWNIEVLARKFAQGLRLSLHRRRAQVFRTSEFVHVLGYQVSKHHRRLRADNGHRARRRLKKLARGYASGRISMGDVSASVRAWIGHAAHADTTSLRKEILSEANFVRATT